ncbi:MAG TPA: S24 family peptidase [Bryobacteraceae bacterium]|jgi:SOS-response transcriptional repressor LexA|nr:S24 family peptidase [Bryobacteraceae bacterium]
MPAAVIPAAVIPINAAPGRPVTRAFWSLLEIATPGSPVVPYGILLAGEAGGPSAMRFRDAAVMEELLSGDTDEPDEDQADFLDSLADDLAAKSLEAGGLRLMDSLEDSLSHFIRISERTPIAYSGDAQSTADRLFEEHVDATIHKFVTHLPLYSLRAAATRFGEYMDAVEEGWVRVPAKLRPSEEMFVARVVGRSMEPRIPDGSLCVFRAPVVGSRQGRLLLIEMIDLDDASQRYTVKRYARAGHLTEGAEREAPIRLEPLNKDFEAFELTSDRYRVVAEFVQVLTL